MKMFPVEEIEDRFAFLQVCQLTIVVCNYLLYYRIVLSGLLIVKTGQGKQ